MQVVSFHRFIEQFSLRQASKFGDLPFNAERDRHRTLQSKKMLLGLSLEDISLIGARSVHVDHYIHIVRNKILLTSQAAKL